MLCIQCGQVIRLFSVHAVEHLDGVDTPGEEADMVYITCLPVRMRLNDERPAFAQKIKLFSVRHVHYTGVREVPELREPVDKKVGAAVRHFYPGKDLKPYLLTYSLALLGVRKIEFYLMSRGISEEEARAMIVSGFADNVSKELPLEYAVEMNNLIRLEMQGSIG